MSAFLKAVGKKKFALRKERSGLFATNAELVLFSIDRVERVAETVATAAIDLSSSGQLSDLHDR